MYVIYTTPILAFLLCRIYFYHKVKFFLPGLLLFFVYSNVNFIFSNNKYFISPQDTIDYKKYYNFWNSDLKISDKDLIVISPSYNKSSYDLYNDSSNAVIYLNPFTELDYQLIKIDKEFERIIFFHERHDRDTETKIDEYLIDFNKSVSLELNQRSFLTKNIYSYFKINIYTKS